MKGKITDRGFLCKTSLYGDSSLILKVFTRQYGMLSLIAKGIRRKSEANQLIALNLYEFTMYEPQDGTLYLLSEFALLKEHELTTRTENWVAAQCAVELYSQMMIPHDEHPAYFELLSSFLDYLDTLGSNSFLIWWRFMLRIFALLGIPWDTRYCCECQSPARQTSALKRESSDLICTDCLSGLADRDSLVTLTPATAQVLYLLPEIGNHLSSITLDKRTVIQMNRLIADHYSTHFHSELKIRSLGVWEDLVR